MSVDSSVTFLLLLFSLFPSLLVLLFCSSLPSLSLSPACLLAYVTPFLCLPVVSIVWRCVRLNTFLVCLVDVCCCCCCAYLILACDWRVLFDVQRGWLLFGWLGFMLRLGTVCVWMCVGSVVCGLCGGPVLSSVNGSMTMMRSVDGDDGGAAVMFVVLMWLQTLVCCTDQARPSQEGAAVVPFGDKASRVVVAGWLEALYPVCLLCSCRQRGLE